MYTETFDHSIEDKIVEIYPEDINGSRPIRHDSIEVLNGSECSSSDSERQIDVITRDESGDNDSPDTHIKRTKSLSSSGRKSSSSSLSESSDDFFGIDTLKFTASEPASKSGKNYASGSDESSAKSEADNSPPVPTSTYQVYNVAYSPKGMSPTISPPVQVMDRSGRCDSTRIPSSIFEINSNNPLEWSLASNDSLFSIHIDRTSFSRDHTFKFRESHRSEELTEPAEQKMLNQIPSVTIEKIDIASKSDDMEKLKALEESFKFKPNFKEDQHDIKSLHEVARSMSTKSSVTSLSHESETIRHSFVPLNKRSRRFCNFCNCSWGFCHYKRPTYCLAWPSCKCSCGWLLCSCCNCSLSSPTCGFCHPKRPSWGFCHHKQPTCCLTWPSCKCSCGWFFCSCCNSSLSSPILTETDGNSFVKRDDTPRQESYKEESETTSSSSSSSCWHCFQSKHACDCCSNLSCNSCNWFHCFTCPTCSCKLSCARCKCCC